MANGMPISAIVGKRKIMKNFDKIFFSTTFGGETLSIVAALETIKYLEKKNVIYKIKKFSKQLVKDINKLIYKNKLNNVFTLEGVWWRPSFGIKSGINKKYLIALRRNLIINKLLIGNSFNFCYAHTQKKIYKNILNKIDKALKKTKLINNINNLKVKKNNLRS